MFDCETCPLREWEERLDDLNRRALMAHALLGRFGIKDLGLSGAVLETMGLQMRRLEALGFLERVAMIHEHYVTEAQRQARDERERD